MRWGRATSRGFGLLRRNLYLILIFIALLLRIILLPTYFHVDILSTTAWGKWIRQYGPFNFYQTSGWIYSSPTQLPIANLIFAFGFLLYGWILWLFVSAGHLKWFFDFSHWFMPFSLSGYMYGELITQKIVPILADIAIAWLIYKIALKAKRAKPWLYGAIYLFFPFSWYLSALWGQYDQLGFLFILSAFILLINRWIILALLCFTLGVNLKPTFLIFIPLFLFSLFIIKPRFVPLLLGVILSIGMYLYSLSLFTTKNPLEFTQHDLKRIVFEKSEYRVVNTALNFWLVIFSTKPQNQNIPFLFVPAKYWAYLAVLTLNILSFQIVRRNFNKNIFLAMFVIGFGNFLFLTNMSERYAFAGVVSGLTLAIYAPKVMKYWIILATIFSINLYYSWLFPGSKLLVNLFSFGGHLSIRLLSLVNIIVFVRILSLVDSKIHR